MAQTVLRLSCRGDAQTDTDRAHAGRWRRVCRPGTGAAFDRAGLRRRQARTTADHAAGLCAPAPEGLDHHAGRLRPRRLSPRHDRHRHAARRPGGGRLGGELQAGGARVAAAARGREARRAACRRPAEPRRGQPDLARALRRALRGDTVRILRAYNARLAELSKPDLPHPQGQRATISSASTSTAEPPARRP